MEFDLIKKINCPIFFLVKGGTENFFPQSIREIWRKNKTLGPKSILPSQWHSDGNGMTFFFLSCGETDSNGIRNLKFIAIHCLYHLLQAGTYSQHYSVVTKTLFL